MSIDATHASGEPIENYGYLKAKPGEKTPSLGDQLRAADAVLHLAEALKLAEALEETEKEVQGKANPPTRPSNH